MILRALWLAANVIGVVKLGFRFLGQYRLRMLTSLEFFSGILQIEGCIVARVEVRRCLLVHDDVSLGF